MRDEDSNAVFDGHQPGILKRPWQAVDGDIEAGSVGYSQDPVHQSKWLCLPKSTENAGLIQQVVSSTPLLPSDGISRLGFATPSSDFLDPTPASTDFSRINGLNSSLMWSQYPPISSGDRLAQHEIFSSWPASLGCYTGELNPTEQCWPLGEAEQAFGCQKPGHWLFTEDLGTDHLA